MGLTGPFAVVGVLCGSEALLDRNPFPEPLERTLRKLHANSLNLLRSSEKSKSVCTTKLSGAWSFAMPG